MAERPFVPNFVLEVAPGWKSNENDRRLRQQLGDVINNILNYIDESTINNVNTVNVGFGTAAGEWVIGQSLPDTSAPYNAREYLTNGNRALQVLPDGQLMVMWVEENGVTNDKTACLLKARSPFTTWTNLDETDCEPTRQVFVTGGGSGSSFQPCFCINPTTGNLHVVGYGGGANRDYIFANDGTGRWTYSGNYTIGGGSHKLCHLVATDGYLLFITYINAAAVGATYFATQAGETVWSAGVYWDRIWNDSTLIYNGLSSVPEQQRIVPLGGGKVLVIMDYFANGSQRNLAWAMSYDDGVTFPAGGISNTTINKYRGIGYPGDATGCLFPVTAGLSPTANLIGTGNTSTAVSAWEVFRIGDTQRVGLVYSGVFDASSGNQPAGTFYAEFDADALLWTPQSDHFLLTRQNVINSTTSLLTSTDGSASFQNISGKAICSDDETVRCFWFHGYDTTGPADTMVGIGTRKLAGADLKVKTDWNAWRVAKSFGGVSAAVNYRNTEFCGANGTVEIEGVTFYPIIWTRQRGGVTALSTHELCFQLLPLAVLDAP